MTYPEARNEADEAFMVEQERMRDELPATTPQMVTILDIAKARGLNPDHATGEAFEKVGLAIMGGCQRCHATIAAYNAYPSRTGYWLCGDCIDERTGFADVLLFEVWDRQHRHPDRTDDYANVGLAIEFLERVSNEHGVAEVIADDLKHLREVEQRMRDGEL